jgi:hypothetical protein
VCLVPQVMVIFIVFGGVYVNSENVPRALKWLPNISLIKHCFEALCVNEFRGLDFETRRRPGEVATGEQVRELLRQARAPPSPALPNDHAMTVFDWWYPSVSSMQALERVGFGDSTIKGCALGQASSTVSCLNCAAAPGKKLPAGNEEQAPTAPPCPLWFSASDVLCRPASSCLLTG